jgi:hypothetical protein
MRIKIIGDNHCARATRHLLRLAGFAVTEFLPADVILSAPHSGYAITIETAAENLRRASAPGPSAKHAVSSSLAPAPHPLNAAFAPSAGALTDVPATEPDLSTLAQPAMLRGETFRDDRGVSSPAFFSETAGAEILLATDEKRPAEDSQEFSTRGCPAGHIHFDSVDGALEAAVLRHVSRISKVPVMVDRPGGVVHSERELRIVVPCTGDEKADESAAVAVEFGVLRGLLDLTRRPSQSELSGAAADAGSAPDSAGNDLEKMSKAGGARGSRNKWWFFGVAFFVLAAALFGALVDAAPRVKVAGDAKSSRTKQGAEKMTLNPSGVKTPEEGKILVPRLKPRPTNSSPFSASSPFFASSPFTASSSFFASPPFSTSSIVFANSVFPGSSTFSAVCEACLTGGGNVALGMRPVAMRARGTRLAVVRRAALFAAAAGPAPAAQGQFATGQAVKIFDGTNTLIVDPCKGQTKLFVSINQTANAQLATGTAAKKIYVCSIHVVVAAATSVALVEGTGTVCATGTTGVSGFGGATAATGWSFMANGGIALGSGDAAVGAEGTAADNLCLFNSGSGQVSGGISYVVQ